MLLAGVSFAFVCGFAGLEQVHVGSPGAAMTAIGWRDEGTRSVAPRPPDLDAAHPDLVVTPSPFDDRTREAPAHAPAAARVGPRTERLRSFAPDVGELAWLAVHGHVDGRLWRSAEHPPAEVGHGRGLAGIDFPAIVRSPGDGMRVYRPLVTWQDVPEGRVPIARVRCMGLRPAAVARRAARYEARIVELATEHGVGASLVKAVITEESCFDPKALSSVGAVGLMQLMPATAAWLGVSDPRDPDENLAGGIRYLAMLETRFGDTTLALAAYNAGPANVERYGGVPPFAETRRYVRHVRAHQRRYVAATALAAR